MNTTTFSAAVTEARIAFEEAWLERGRAINEVAAMSLAELNDPARLAWVDAAFEALAAAEATYKAALDEAAR